MGALCCKGNRNGPITNKEIIIDNPLPNFLTEEKTEFNIELKQNQEEDKFIKKSIKCSKQISKKKHKYVTKISHSRNNNNKKYELAYQSMPIKYNNPKYVHIKSKYMNDYKINIETQKRKSIPKNFLQLTMKGSFSRMNRPRFNTESLIISE